MESRCTVMTYFLKRILTRKAQHHTDTAHYIPFDSFLENFRCTVHRVESGDGCHYESRSSSSSSREKETRMLLLELDL